MRWCHTYCGPLIAAVVWSRHTTPSIPRWRERALRDETKWRLRKGLLLLPFLKQRENKNYSSTVSCLKNIIPGNSVASPIDPNQRYLAILNKWRYIEREKRIVFQRRLIGCCLSRLCPLCLKCVIRCRLFTRN